MLIKCPSCFGFSTIPIFYGEQSPEIQRAAERGLAELTGCVTFDGNRPRFRCIDCNLGWCPAGTEDGQDPVVTLREVEQIVRKHLYPIFTGMISSAIFSQGSNSQEAMHSYLRLKQLFLVDGGCSMEQVSAVIEFKASHPDTYDDIIRDLAHQVSLLSLEGRGFGGLYENMFQAAALLLNASPISSANSNPEWISHFRETIRQGNLGME